VQRTWQAFVAVVISHDLRIMRPQRRHARRALRHVIHLQHRPAPQRQQADPDHHPEPHQQHRPRPIRRHARHHNLRHSEISSKKQRRGAQDHRPAPPAPHNDLIEKETHQRRRPARDRVRHYRSTAPNIAEIAENKK